MWDPGGSEVGELLVTSDDLSRAGSRVAESVVCSSAVVKRTVLENVM